VFVRDQAHAPARVSDVAREVAAPTVRRRPPRAHVANCGAASTATARAATRRENRIESIFFDSILGGLGTRDESGTDGRGFSFGC
jgi:plasmid replication initiation protein